MFSSFSFSALISSPPAVYIAAMETECVIHGRTITPEELEGVRRLLRDHPDWSRLRISREVCAAWDWRLPAPSKARQAGNAKGELRDIACRTVLLRLHRGGRIDLPKRTSRTSTSTG